MHVPLAQPLSGAAGPCKHILAVRMKVEGADNVKLDDAEAAASERELPEDRAD